MLTLNAVHHITLWCGIRCERTLGQSLYGDFMLPTTLLHSLSVSTSQNLLKLCLLQSLSKSQLHTITMLQTRLFINRFFNSALMLPVNDSTYNWLRIRQMRVTAYRKSASHQHLCINRLKNALKWWLRTSVDLIMAALWNRAGHYIFALWFPSFFLLLYFFFFLPNLSGRRLDVYHTSTHGVALVQI